MKRRTQRLIARMQRSASDVGVLVGLGMIDVGLYLVDPRVFWIVGGAIAVVLSILTAAPRRS